MLPSWAGEEGEIVPIYSAFTGLYSLFVYIGGQWISFGTVPVGILPINANGARVTAGGAAPSSGDITFLS